MSRANFLSPAALVGGGLLLAFFFAGPQVAGADLIVLKNGKTLEGTMLDLGNGKVRIDLTYGSLTMPAAQVEEVQPALTLEESLSEELAALEDADAAGRYRLAERARRAQSFTLHRRLLEAVLEADPDHERARRKLGFVPYEGAWVTQEQLHELKGEVLFRGKWMTSRERDQTLTAQEDRRSRIREEALSRRQREAEARAEARIREAERAEAEARQYAALRQRGSFSVSGAVALPGCTFGNLAGVNAFVPQFGTGGFQTLEPFQPGLIQVPRQNYNYSFLQVHRTRGPRPRQLPRSGYRREFRLSTTR